MPLISCCANISITRPGAARLNRKLSGPGPCVSEGRTRSWTNNWPVYPPAGIPAGARCRSVDLADYGLDHLPLVVLDLINRHGDFIQVTFLVVGDVFAGWTRPRDLPQRRKIVFRLGGSGLF